MNKLEGDQFTTEEWVAAHETGKPVDLPCESPDELLNALNNFVATAARLGIPAMGSFCIQDETITESDLGSKPQNVNLQFMLARGGLTGVAEYNQNFTMNALSRMGINAFLGK